MPRPRTAELAESQPPREEYTVTVARGRKLGVAEFGTEDGLPVLWFHGTPGGRRQVPLSARIHARKKGLRLIAVERPGIGDSTPHLYDNISGWAEDIERLADDLELPRFGLVGLSGGGPYVLACAHHMPDRVIGAAIFGGVAPTLGSEAEEGGLAGKAVPVERWLTLLRKPLGVFLSKAIQVLHPLADPIFDAVVKYGPESEASMLGDLELRAIFVDDILLGSRVGLHSVISDIILFARPWGFSIGDIRVPVHFWQGTQDPLVPVQHAQAQASRIPGAEVTICDDAGHLAGLGYATEALDFILAQVGKPAQPKKKRAARKAAPVKRIH